MRHKLTAALPATARRIQLLADHGWPPVKATLRALNVIRRDYGFTDGWVYLEDVLDVLQHTSHLTPAERQLRQELEVMPHWVRESTSRAIPAARTKPATDWSE